MTNDAQDLLFSLWGRYFEYGQKALRRWTDASRRIRDTPEPADSEPYELRHLLRDLLATWYDGIDLALCLPPLREGALAVVSFAVFQGDSNSGAERLPLSGKLKLAATPLLPLGGGAAIPERSVQITREADEAVWKVELVDLPSDAAAGIYQAAVVSLREQGGSSVRTVALLHLVVLPSLAGAGDPG